MRFAAFQSGEQKGLAVAGPDGEFRGLMANEAAYQKKAPQWTIGKNFDGTGAFGPYLVTADELPAGGQGLRIQTRLNGSIMQDASTNDMIFSVARLISILSEAITLSPGDILVSGTPSGVGMARKPPLFMKAGDVCEVEIEHIGILRNRVEDESSHADKEADVTQMQLT